MKTKILLAVTVLAISVTPLVAQQVIFKGLTAGALVKAGPDGIAAELTTGTATSTAAAATLNTDMGKITTESLTTAGAGAATYTFTLTNSLITTASKIFVSLETTSAGIPSAPIIAPGTGSCTIKWQNAHPTAAFNNTFKINFLVAK